MDSPNKNRLRVVAVIGATALAGLVGSTMAAAVSGSGAPVAEGSAHHVKVVVPTNAWTSKCDFFVAAVAKDIAAKEAAAKQAAEAKAEKAAKIKAEKAEKAEKAKAEKAKAEKAAKIKAAKAAKAEKAAALKAKGDRAKGAKDPDRTWRHHRGGWGDDRSWGGDRDGGCSGHDKGDDGSKEKSDA